jgi:hypothetical protein
MPWEDMGIYWARRGTEPHTPAPTCRELVYSRVVSSVGVCMDICTEVIDDGVPHKVNQGELLWLLENGWQKQKSGV